MNSPYSESIVFQDEALTKLIELTKNYVVGGVGTGILTVPVYTNEGAEQAHLQIQNAIKLSVDNVNHPGKLIITDNSVPSNSDDPTRPQRITYMQVGDVFNFESGNSNSNHNVGTQNYGSFTVCKNVVNNNYNSTNTKFIYVYGFDPDTGNFTAPGCNINVTGGTGTGIITGTKVRGAVFNDYAEYRQSNEKEPGLCVVETGKGDLIKSTQRLQLGANIISDTFGFSIGQSEQYDTPIAVCGRVLAIPADPISLYTPGAAVCSAPGGKISVMTREEIKEWPDAIIGYVSEIPIYEVWGTDNIKVNGRIWIKIK